jgi:hypothetical protein
MRFFKRKEPEPEADKLAAFMRAPKEPLSWPVKVFFAVAMALPLFMAYNVMFGGLTGAGYAWFGGVDAVWSVVAWRIELYGWLALPGLAVAAFFLRYALPTVILSVLGAGEHEAHTKEVWYNPFSMRVEGDFSTWREGAYTAKINKAYLKKLHGFGFHVIQPVLRRVDERSRLVLYETQDLEASKLEASGARERMLLEELTRLRLMRDTMEVAR